MDYFQRSTYHYDLPEELIAQHPVTPRDHSRLMVVNRKTGEIQTMKFYEINDLLSSGDRLIFNDTKVIPARLLGKRAGGGQAEVFLLKPLPNDVWEVLVRPGKKLREGSKVWFADNFFCEILEVTADGGRLARMHYEGNFSDVLNRYGQMPLPHYIHRDSSEESDNERYQTVFAQNEGAVAAPTAGLHFTKELLDSFSKKGVGFDKITLHVGIGTFRPVQVDNILDHKMHFERYEISPMAAERLNQPSDNNLRICVGTTCCRTLESAALPDGTIQAGSAETDIFIYPGYQFKYVSSLLTNFHLPCSTLLMLVSAFAGYDLTMEAYERAVKEKFRFFSYGDAMLII